MVKNFFFFLLFVIYLFNFNHRCTSEILIGTQTHFWKFAMIGHHKSSLICDLIVFWLFVTETFNLGAILHLDHHCVWNHSCDFSPSEGKDKGKAWHSCKYGNLWSQQLSGLKISACSSFRKIKPLKSNDNKTKCNRYISYLWIR